MGGAAKIAISSPLQILALVLQPCLAAATSAHPSRHPSTPSSSPAAAPDYSRRFAEELSVEADRAGALIRHLSFADGDWSQDAGHAPVAGRPELPPLASFRVTQVQSQRRGAFNVSGLLTFTEVCEHGVAEFRAPFHGVYTETRSSLSGGGGGERVLCMVGNSALPWRRSNITDLRNQAKNGAGAGEASIFEQPAAAAANVATLTTRAVRGEMTSLSAATDGAYFDTVRLVSRLGSYSKYLFTTQEEELDADDGDVAADGHFYRGASFCEILGRFTSYKDYVLLPVVPNWNCRSTEDELCARAGPFDAGGRGRENGVHPCRRHGAGPPVRAGLRCERGGGGESVGGAPVRSPVGGLGRGVEADRPGRRDAVGRGRWNASTGRLRMAACLGSGEDACSYRVTLHVPTAFSITRRSIIVVRISATDGSHHPLSFQQRVPPGQNWHQFGRSGEAVPMAYHYAKVEQAGELLRRRKPSGRFRSNFLARFLLSYPSFVDDDAGDDLLPFVPEWIEDPFNIELQILSVGTLVGSYSPPQFEDGSSTPAEQIDRAHGNGGMGKQHVINVSAEFTAIRMYLGPVPVMSVEGVYDPEDGRMYLIGCRNVHAPWRVLARSRDLEDGMDCSIEVTVQYPPTDMRWLINPAAKVSVASTREDDDPLRFTRTELRSMPVVHRDQRGVLTETELEDLLCIAVLSATIVAAAGQLCYPYVSLAMLGVQALGYGATLVANARMLPAWPRHSYKLYADHLECSVRALTLAALLLTAWLAHKVWWSMVQARARAPLEPGRVPRDGAVLAYSLAVYLGGLVAVAAVHWLRTTPPPRGAGAEAGTMPPPSSMEWFLLPQVIGNALWRVNCKPLAARYYAGVTAAWLLPHVYGYLRPPVVGMYPGALYSKAGAVVPGVGVVLALLVFCFINCFTKIDNENVVSPNNHFIS
ncbi:hypothetical protein PVAP13_1NG136000 [Panicum virgatum]|uniref:RING-type E3 ubiquitin transferase n=1 Tax=Panicum virgatum TaxID=38727 RepID=A0A8T0WPC5_PANVG|nr:hypothetical protein PVAP13_1NG136000 [Panicum virgatum]